MRYIDLTQIAAASAEQVAGKFMKSKDQILQQGYGYMIFATLIIAAMMIVVVGGSLFGLCQAVNLGEICNWSSTARKAFVFVNMLAIVFWVLYYVNLREQQSLLDQINPNKFLSEELKQQFNKISLSTRQLFIIANVCSIPIYLLFVVIVFRLLALILRWAGLKVF